MKEEGIKTVIVHRDDEVLQGQGDQVMNLLLEKAQASGSTIATVNDDEDKDKEQYVAILVPVSEYQQAQSTTKQQQKAPAADDEESYFSCGSSITASSRKKPAAAKAARAVQTHLITTTRPTKKKKASSIPRPTHHVAVAKRPTKSSALPTTTTPTTNVDASLVEGRKPSDESSLEEQSKTKPTAKHVKSKRSSARSVDDEENMENGSMASRNTLGSASSRRSSPVSPVRQRWSSAPPRRSTPSPRHRRDQSHDNETVTSWNSSQAGSRISQTTAASSSSRISRTSTRTAGTSASTRRRRHYWEPTESSHNKDRRIPHNRPPPTVTPFKANPVPLSTYRYKPIVPKPQQRKQYSIMMHQHLHKKEVITELIHHDDEAVVSKEQQQQHGTEHPNDARKEKNLIQGEKEPPKHKNAEPAAALELQLASQKPISASRRRPFLKMEGVMFDTIQENAGGAKQPTEDDGLPLKQPAKDDDDLEAAALEALLSDNSPVASSSDGGSTNRATQQNQPEEMTVVFEKDKALRHDDGDKGARLFGHGAMVFEATAATMVEETGFGSSVAPPANTKEAAVRDPLVVSARVDDDDFAVDHSEEAVREPAIGSVQAKGDDALRPDHSEVAGGRCEATPDARPEESPAMQVGSLVREENEEETQKAAGHSAGAIPKEPDGVISSRSAAQNDESSKGRASIGAGRGHEEGRHHVDALDNINTAANSDPADHQRHQDAQEVGSGEEASKELGGIKALCELTQDLGAVAMGFDENTNGERAQPKERNTESRENATSARYQASAFDDSGSSNNIAGTENIASTGQDDLDEAKDPAFRFDQLSRLSLSHAEDGTDDSSFATALGSDGHMSERVTGSAAGVDDETDNNSFATAAGHDVSEQEQPVVASLVAEASAAITVSTSTAPSLGQNPLSSEPPPSEQFEPVVKSVTQQVSCSGERSERAAAVDEVAPSLDTKGSSGERSERAAAVDEVAPSLDTKGSAISDDDAISDAKDPPANLFARRVPTGRFAILEDPSASVVPVATPSPVSKNRREPLGSDPREVSQQNRSRMMSLEEAGVTKFGLWAAMGQIWQHSVEDEEEQEVEQITSTEENMTQENVVVGKCGRATLPSVPTTRSKISGDEVSSPLAAPMPTPAHSGRFVVFQYPALGEVPASDPKPSGHEENKRLPTNAPDADPAVVDLMVDEEAGTAQLGAWSSRNKVWQSSVFVPIVAQDGNGDGRDDGDDTLEFGLSRCDLAAIEGDHSQGNALSSTHTIRTPRCTVLQDPSVEIMPVVTPVGPATRRQAIASDPRQVSTSDKSQVLLLEEAGAIAFGLWAARNQLWQRSVSPTNENVPLEHEPVTRSTSFPHHSSQLKHATQNAVKHKRGAEKTLTTPSGVAVAVQGDHRRRDCQHSFERKPGAIGSQESAPAREMEQSIGRFDTINDLTSSASSPPRMVDVSLDSTCSFDNEDESKDLIQPEAAAASPRKAVSESAETPGASGDGGAIGVTRGTNYENQTPIKPCIGAVRLSSAVVVAVLLPMGVFKVRSLLVAWFERGNVPEQVWAVRRAVDVSSRFQSPITASTMTSERLSNVSLEAADMVLRRQCSFRDALHPKIPLQGVRSKQLELSLFAEAVASQCLATTFNTDYCANANMTDSFRVATRPRTRRRDLHHAYWHHHDGNGNVVENKEAATGRMGAAGGASQRQALPEGQSSVAKQRPTITSEMMEVGELGISDVPYVPLLEKNDDTALTGKGPQKEENRRATNWFAGGLGRRLNSLVAKSCDDGECERRQRRKQAVNARRRGRKRHLSPNPLAAVASAISEKQGT